MNFELSFGGNQPMGILGKLFCTLILFIFLVAGVFFEVMLARELTHELVTRNWTETSCTILNTHVPEKSPYTAQITYAYTFAGQSYQGHTLSFGYNGSSEFYDAQKIAEAYPANSHSTCRVDPIRPVDAVLQVPSLWRIPTLLFPLLFVLTGAGGAYFVWKPAKLASQTSSQNNPRAIAVVGFSFGITGIVLIAVAGWMIHRARAAAQWPAVPCRIIESHVQSTESDNSTTYGIGVLFRYRFNDRQYDSSRYSLVSVSSSDYNAKQQAVNAFNQNPDRICYVNPSDPAEAVLDREQGNIVGYVLIAVAGVLIVIGIFALTRFAKRAAPAVNSPPVKDDF